MAVQRTRQPRCALRSQRGLRHHRADPSQPCVVTALTTLGRRASERDTMPSLQPTLSGQRSRC
jgi:hypothetical protein